MMRLLSYDLKKGSSVLMHKDYHYNLIDNIDILNSDYSDANISISKPFLSEFLLIILQKF